MARQRLSEGSHGTSGPSGWLYIVEIQGPSYIRIVGAIERAKTKGLWGSTSTCRNEMNMHLIYSLTYVGALQLRKTLLVRLKQHSEHDCTSTAARASTGSSFHFFMKYGLRLVRARMNICRLVFVRLLSTAEASLCFLPQRHVLLSPAPPAFCTAKSIGSYCRGGSP